MDGFKGISHSLQARLSLWLALVILGVAVLAGVFAFESAFQEANELQDDQLRQIAAVVHHQHLPLLQSETSAGAPEVDAESLVVFQLLPAPGQPELPAAPGSIAFPSDLKDGMQTVSVDKQSWRVVVQTLGNSQRIVVGQRTSTRDEIARDSAVRTLLPLAILIPVLLLLVGILIRSMLRPVKALADELNQRPEDDLRSVSESGIPTEIAPFVAAINRLLARVTQSMALQRRFLADAAHELRTPLTALSLQAERLGTADMSLEARDRLKMLQGGLKRSQQLLNQLLALARAQDAEKKPPQAVSVRAIFLITCEELMPLAEARDIDLGLVSEQDQTVQVSEMDLRILVKNLVDNAIRYTPVGGRIDLSVLQRQGKPMLCVEDNGPGIAPQDRARVFDPFYRVLGHDETGSGLGLSIVQTIATRMGAQIHLEYANAAMQSGLRVEVVFDVQR
jgi:two-component system OmpR family sensor kinase